MKHEVTVIPIIICTLGRDNLKIRVHVETIQTTALLRSVRIYREEFWRLEETFHHSNSRRKPSTNASEKNSQKSNKIITWAISSCLQKNEKELEIRLHKKIYNQDIAMEFGMEKCTMLIMKSGKEKKKERMKLTHREIIKTLRKMENYKYLGILEADTIKQTEIKEKYKKGTSEERENFSKPNSTAERL